MELSGATPVGRHHPVPAGVFGLVEGLIRSPQAGFRVLAMLGINRHSQGNGDASQALAVMLQVQTVRPSATQPRG